MNAERSCRPQRSGPLPAARDGPSRPSAPFRFERARRDAAARLRRRLRSRSVCAPGQVVEECQAAPGVPGAPSPFGEPGVMGAVDLDEAVRDRGERARFEMALDQAPPPERSRPRKKQLQSSE